MLVEYETNYIILQIDSCEKYDKQKNVVNIAQ